MSAPGADPIEAFAMAAAAYCEWAESPPAGAATEAHRARQLVLELLRRAIDLPDVFSDAGTPDIADEDYRNIYKRFGALPFNYYSQCFDPLVVPSEESVVADLADDLADIWRDVKRGLLLWRENAAHAAAWDWRFHFSAHWGHHASSALYALQAWFSQNVDESAEAERK